MPGAERAVAAALRFAALAGLYLAFVGQAPIPEIAAGLLAGLATMAFSLSLRAAGDPPMRLRAPWLRLAPRLAWSMLRDAIQVAATLARAAVSGGAGRAASRRMARTGEGAAESGHRALVILLASVAPNGYVLESKGATLRLHRLARTAAAADPKWPI